LGDVRFGDLFTQGRCASHGGVVPQAEAPLRVEKQMSEERLLETPFDLDAVFEVDDYMAVYRDDLTSERSDAEVAAWVELLELDAAPAGKRILDLACGFGRHANRLAALGHSVVGMDMMPGFLEMARQRAAELGVQVDYRQGDMRELDFVEEFDLVLLLFTSFGYFGDEENVRVMENVARALKPGGLLGFDVPNRDAVTKDVPSAHVIDRDGDLTINRLSFDVLSGRFHNRRILIRDGVRKDKPFSIRLYNATEIRDLLNRAGLQVRKMVGYGGQPLSADSRGILVVAPKPFPG
jgi:SAM-dependent methyltransferase